MGSDTGSDFDFEAIFDGLAAWQEFKPQDGEDWVEIAERCLAADDETLNPTPLFSGLLRAVAERDAALSAHEVLKHAAQQVEVKLRQPGNEEPHHCAEVLSEALDQARDLLREAGEE